MVWYMLFISCPTGLPDIIFSYLIGGNGVVYVIYFLSYRITWYLIQLPDWWEWCGICWWEWCGIFLVLQDCLISYSVTWLVGMVWYMLFISCPTGLPDIIFSYLISGDGVVYVIYFLSCRIAWYHIQLPDWWEWCGICYLFLVLQDCLISYSVTWLVEMVSYMRAEDRTTYLKPQKSKQTSLKSSFEYWQLELTIVSRMWCRQLTHFLTISYRLLTVCDSFLSCILKHYSSRSLSPFERKHSFQNYCSILREYGIQSKYRHIKYNERSRKQWTVFSCITVFKYSFKQCIYV